MKIQLIINNPFYELIIEDDIEGSFYDNFNKLIAFLQSNVNIFEIKPDLEISKIIKKSPEYEKMTPSEKETYSEPILKVSNDCGVSPRVLTMILDFESKQIVPTILHQITKEPRTEAQRPAVVIALYLNKTLRDDSTLSSKQLTGILTDSNIDAASLSDAFRTKWKEYLKIQNKSYRILPRGIIKARELLKNFSENYIES